ncbi:MAG: hypothetical protein ACFFBH_07065 [Promethearchaeota archaeon]
MVKHGGRRVIHFYNQSGKIDNAIKFLENIQKKVNYLNLNCEVEGKEIKVTLYGPKDLQYLAIERLRELANQFLS